MRKGLVIKIFSENYSPKFAKFTPKFLVKLRASIGYWFLFLSKLLVFLGNQNPSLRCLE